MQVAEETSHLPLNSPITASFPFSFASNSISQIWVLPCGQPFTAGHRFRQLPAVLPRTAGSNYGEYGDDSESAVALTHGTQGQGQCQVVYSGESEYLVKKAMSRLLKGRTSIVIAHRISTIKNADNIFIFEDGRLIEQGTFNELLERQGRFWQLHEYNINDDLVGE